MEFYAFFVLSFAFLAALSCRSSDETIFSTPHLQQDPVILNRKPLTALYKVSDRKPGYSPYVFCNLHRPNTTTDYKPLLCPVLFLHKGNQMTGIA